MALLASVSATDLADAADRFRAGAVEKGVSVGLGDNFHTDFAGGNVREDVTFLTAMLSRGKVLTELNRGRSIQFAVEGSLGLAKQEAHIRFAVGATPLVVCNFETSTKITAFAEAGLGLLYTDLDPERFGSRLNFTPQVGIGVRYRLAEGRFLRVSYRLHHISNAGMSDANRGIDSSFLMLGISVVR